jgi:enoyl-CoA hydratase/carnithine racemase
MPEETMSAVNALDLETMTLERPAPSIAVLTLNRPDRLNAMTMRMFDELMAVPQALKEDESLRALVVIGAGRGFCAGYDLDQIHEITELGVREFLKFQELATGGLAAIRGLQVPVIAAVNGAAAGGGLALALAADIRLASPTARFNAAFVKIGLSCGELGTSWTLTRLVGPGRAAEIAYTGRMVDAEEAERIGLVNRVVDGDREALLDEALALAAQIASNSPGGVQLSKRALQANLEISSYAAALELENRGQALLTRGEDMPEALQAFKDKRAPQFTGR